MAYNGYNDYRDDDEDDAPPQPCLTPNVWKIGAKLALISRGIGTQGRSPTCTGFLKEISYYFYPY